MFQTAVPNILSAFTISKYSLVPNRRGDWNKRGGGWKNLQNIISGWGGIAGGGLEMMQQFSHFFVSIETKITKPECAMLCSQ